MRPRAKTGLAILLFLALAAPAAAQGVGFQRWGLRAGASDKPDQLVAGLQIDLGEIIEQLRFQPHLDLGVGDDQTLVTLGAPFVYRLPEVGPFEVYGGAGVAMALLDTEDDPNRSGDESSDFIITPLFVGGFSRLVGPSEAAVELNLGGGDLPNVKLVFSWMF